MQIYYIMCNKERIVGQYGQNAFRAQNPLLMGSVRPALGVTQDG